jgi:hypothetical protein
MGVYTAEIQIAKKLIASKGQKVQWQVTPSVTPDASKPWKKVNGDKTVDPVIIAFLPASSLLAKFQAGSNIAEGGMRGIMAAVVGWTPSEDDIVIRDGRNMALKSLDEINVNGESILWKMEFKK